MNNMYPSLETCRKISHLFPETEMVIDKDGSLYLRERFSFDEVSGCVSCPNIAELIDKLPTCLYIYKRSDRKYSVKITGSMSSKKVNFLFINKSLPEALGQLLHRLDKEKVL